MKIDENLNEYINEVQKRPNSPSILVESIYVENALNVYHARQMNQRHYKNETYQLQLDSHHRFVKDWDTTSIKQLHSCDAGEYSVITAYAPQFLQDDWQDEYSYAELDTERPFNAIFLYEFVDSGWFAKQPG